MSYYRKRPVTIEAIQWTGDNWQELFVFTDGQVQIVMGPHLLDRATEVFDVLHDTWVTFHINDWIIKGVKGEFYPCNATVFTETYEKAEPK